MPGTPETSNFLAILAGARRPQWTVPGTYTGAPATANAGVSLLANGTDERGVLACGAAVAMRENVHRRAFRITPTFDAATTYTITIGGVGSGGAIQATIALLLAELISDINATSGATVTAIADPAAPLTTILVTGDAEADYTIGCSVAGGAGTIAVVADPTSATLRAFVTMAGTNADASAVSQAWRLVPDSEIALDYRGYDDTFSPAGRGRLYIELDDVTGTGDVAGASTTITYAPVVLIGPCVVE